MQLYCVMPMTVSNRNTYIIVLFILNLMFGRERKVSKSLLPLIIIRKCITDKISNFPLILHLKLLVRAI